MSDIQSLIEITEKLSCTLSTMADNEKKFGWNICHLMEQLSYDMYKTSQELASIKNYISGDMDYALSNNG